MFRFKQIALIFLSLALLMKAFVVPILCLDFELRKEYIIKNFCINKNRPELNCNGKCFLSKKIEAAQEKEEQQGFQNFVQKLLETNSSEFFLKYDFSNSLIIKELSVKNFKYLQSQSKDCLHSVFHPPLVKLEI